MKGVQEIESIMDVSGRQKNPSLASLGKPLFSLYYSRKW